MDLEKAGLVVCLTLFLVIGFNALIYLSVSHGNVAGSSELFHRATKRARNPWRPEDDDLEQLSELVGKLKEEPPESSKMNKGEEP